jgi:hypothetical protein
VLTARELIRLEEEYGSLAAAAEALPEQREEILAAAERSLAPFRGLGRPFEDLREQRDRDDKKRTLAEEAEHAGRQGWRDSLEASISAVQERPAQEVIIVGDRRRRSARKPTARRRGAKAKRYPGESVEIAVRQLRPWAKEPGRNKAAQNAHLTTRAVDTIIVHMKAGRLRRTEEKGWLVIRGELRATPKWIRLSDLETA